MIGEPILTETRHGGNDPLVINGLEDLQARVGQELGVSSLGSEDMKGSTFTRHQPRNVRQLCVVADHQPAQRGHPVHRRGEAAPGGGGRCHRHPPDRDHRTGLRPSRVRRVHRIAVPDAHPRFARAAQLGARGLLTCRRVGSPGRRMQNRSR